MTTKRQAVVMLSNSFRKHSLKPTTIFAIGNIREKRRFRDAKVLLRPPSRCMGELNFLLPCSQVSTVLYHSLSFLVGAS